MTVLDLMSQLRRAGISLLLEADGQLRVKAAKGAMTPDWRARIKTNKQAIIDFLGQAERSRGHRRPFIQPAPNRDHGMLTYAQEGLWFLHRLEPESYSYNLPLALRLNGLLDESTLRRAFDALAARHDSLRARFTVIEDGPDAGSPKQVYDPPGPVDFEMIDLAGAAPTDSPRIKAEAVRPFSLAKDPLMRVRLFRATAREHVLLIVMHHIIVDGWSLNVMIRELSALYRALMAGEASPLPPNELQFSDYVYWERERLKGDALERQLDFWQERLKRAPSRLELISDFPRPGKAVADGSADASIEDKALLERLESLCKETDVTPFMALMAAFAVLLARHAGQNEVCLGSPSANRNAAELEGVIGYFVNTLVFHIDLSGAPDFKTLLARVRETAIETFAHGDAPFDRIVERVKPERDLGRTPLFQAMFSFGPMDETDDSELELAPGLMATGERLPFSSAKFEMTLNVQFEPGALIGRLEYNASLFREDSAARVVAQYKTLLRGLIADPDRAVNRVALMDAAERRRMIDEWSRDETFTALEPVHRRIAARAAAAPDLPAIFFEDQVISYGELDRLVNQLAQRLRRHGLGPERVAALLATRRPEAVIAMLAVFKTGAAYLPLEPNHPPERIRFAMEDADAKILLTQTGLADALTDAPPKIFLDEADWRAEDAEPPPDLALPDHMAYLIYTSGSTGKPKGTMGTYDSLTMLVEACQQAYRFTEDDRVLQFAAFTFDASMEELWTPLVFGAGMALRTETMLADMRVFLARCSELDLTALSFPTEYWRQLTDYLAEAGVASLPPRLRLVFIGGERANPDAVLKWLKAVGDGVVLWNTYGPAECTVNATGANLTGIDPNEPLRETPIGRPWGSSRIYVLDRCLEPVPAGMPGELYIAGPQLVRGYLDRPGLTAGCFLPNPFADQAGERLYRTGDRVRFLADSALEFLGRVDFQIKLRGFRIEPGEIETALERHPRVKAAAVAPYALSDGDKRLCAYLDLDESADPPEPSVWRAFLHDSLPDYMIPALFIPLDEMPLTTSGKINRRALPEPDLAELERAEAQAFIAPRDDFEVQLAALWAELLRRERVSANANFFDLGGHSLLATRLTYRVWETFDAEMPLAVIFQHPTLEEQAQWLSVVAQPADEIEDEDREEELI